MVTSLGYGGMSFTETVGKGLFFSYNNLDFGIGEEGNWLLNNIRERLVIAGLLTQARVAFYMRWPPLGEVVGEAGVEARFV